jgi:type III pantothenate kinase
MNLIIDIGNTNIKLAVFKDETLLRSEIVNFNNFTDLLIQFIDAYDIKKSILSTVGGQFDGIEVFLEYCFYHINLSSKTKLPITINYETPDTLGADRIALAVEAHAHSNGLDSLVIDMGTCITYDFVTAEGVYQGGAISPGLNMRFKAMHNFTESLPLVTIRESQSIIGKNTEMSLVNGVVHGITAEIDSYIEMLTNEFGHISVFISGGDHAFFVNKLKNSIFADQKILLRGLNRILNYNFNIRNEEKAT